LVLAVFIVDLGNSFGLCIAKEVWHWTLNALLIKLDDLRTSLKERGVLRKESKDRLDNKAVEGLENGRVVVVIAHSTLHVNFFVHVSGHTTQETELSPTGKHLGVNNVLLGKLNTLHDLDEDLLGGSLVDAVHGHGNLQSKEMYSTSVTFIELIWVERLLTEAEAVLGAAFLGVVLFLA
jgi:hypothetical protein